MHLNIDSFFDKRDHWINACYICTPQSPWDLIRNFKDMITYFPMLKTYRKKGCCKEEWRLAVSGWNGSAVCFKFSWFLEWQSHCCCDKLWLYGSWLLYLWPLVLNRTGPFACTYLCHPERWYSPMESKGCQAPFPSATLKSTKTNNVYPSICGNTILKTALIVSVYPSPCKRQDSCLIWLN